LENLQKYFTLEDAVSVLHTKRRGEVAELAFMLRATSLGFGVAKPWGDSDHYDFIVTTGQLFWRVQVKSTWSPQCYQVNARVSSGVAYAPGEIDFLVAYIVSRDIWYVIPPPALGSRKSVHLYPFSRRSPYEKYREAWGQLNEDCKTGEHVSP
jgi:hypothetical protein